MNPGQLAAMRGLSERDAMIYMAEANRSQKSTGLAYVLWFFFGFLGVHKFYIGNWTAWLNLSASALTIAYFVKAFTSPLSYRPSDAFSYTVIIGGVYLALSLFIDLFTIPSQVRRVNEEAAWDILNSLLPDDEDEEESVEGVSPETNPL